MIYRISGIENIYSTPVANSIPEWKRNYTSKILKSKFALAAAGIRVNGQSVGCTGPGQVSRKLASANSLPLQ